MCCTVFVVQLWLPDVFYMSASMQHCDLGVTCPGALKHAYGPCHRHIHDHTTYLTYILAILHTYVSVLAMHTPTVC